MIVMTLLAYHKDRLIADRRCIVELDTNHVQQMFNATKIFTSKCGRMAFGICNYMPSPEQFPFIEEKLMAVVLAMESADDYDKMQSARDVAAKAARDLKNFSGGAESYYIVMTRKWVYRLNMTHSTPWKMVQAHIPYAVGSGASYFLAYVFEDKLTPEKALSATSRRDPLVSPEHDVIMRSSLHPIVFV